MESKTREWWILKQNIIDNDMDVIPEPEHINLFIHVIEYSALESAQAEIAELKAENSLNRSAAENGSRRLNDANARIVEFEDIKGGHLEFVKDLQSKLTSAMEMISVMEEALDYYSKPYVNGGVWIGRISHHEAHGDDMEMIEAFSFAGKLARKALAALEAWKGKRE
jgi:hypothetical protein